CRPRQPETLAAAIATPADVLEVERRGSLILRARLPEHWKVIGSVVQDADDMLNDEESVIVMPRKRISDPQSVAEATGAPLGQGGLVPARLRQFIRGSGR